MKDVSICVAFNDVVRLSLGASVVVALVVGFVGVVVVDTKACAGQLVARQVAAATKKRALHDGMIAL